MNPRIKHITRRKISDFIRLEDGKIGSRSAFTVAALASASTLGVKHYRVWRHEIFANVR
jgi:hypothetical protein